MTSVDPMTRSVLSISTSTLRDRLDEHGIQRTWMGLLRTHILNSEQSTHYILQASQFQDAPLFEQDMLKGLSVGQVSVLYEFSLSYVSAEDRKNSGQYFTPDDVAQMMARQSLSFDSGVWLDPCSGVGNLSYWLVHTQSDPLFFLKNKMLLSDRDPLALFIARALLALSFPTQEGLFFEIEGNFIVRDFLDDEVVEHDYIIMNPPYVTLTTKDTRFDTADALNLFAWFMERAIKTSRGFVSITPQGFTNGKKFESLRAMMKDSGKGFDIMCFDNVPDAIFRGIKFGSTNTNQSNSTRAAVTVFGASSERRITRMLRWTATQRAEMLSKAPDFLGRMTEAPIFPKASEGTQGLLKQCLDQPTLQTLLVKRQTPHSLTVATTPRYYTSAVRRPLQRTSARKLYFSSEDDLNRVYPYLNSSFLFWWWMVDDGELTLSQRTLWNLPLLPVIDKLGSDNFISDLKKSERDNVTIKMNAGRANENVKHSMSLVSLLNQHYFPEWAEELELFHSNSVLG